jgi:hypothetical protein
MHNTEYIYEICILNKNLCKVRDDGYIHRDREVRRTSFVVDFVHGVQGVTEFAEIGEEAANRLGRSKLAMKSLNHNEQSHRDSPKNLIASIRHRISTGGILEA